MLLVSLGPVASSPDGEKTQWGQVCSPSRKPRVVRHLLGAWFLPKETNLQNIPGANKHVVLPHSPALIGNKGYMGRERGEVWTEARGRIFKLWL